MSGTIIERLRSLHEEVEILEKATAKAFHYKDDNPKDGAIADHLAKRFINEAQKKSIEILKIYADKDELKKAEIEVLAGQRDIWWQHENQVFFKLSILTFVKENNQNIEKKPSDVWVNYYTKLKETREHCSKVTETMGDISENPSVEATFDAALTEIKRECDKLFTAEEGNGRFVDMYHLYNAFINLKKLQKEDPKKPNFEIGDYLNYLQNLHKLKEIPLSLKDAPYVNYIDSLYNYLTGFIKKSQPLLDYEKFESDISNIGFLLIKIENSFNTSWEEGTLEGWEKLVQKATVTEADPLFCVACQKKFVNENVFNHHKTGKKHIKSVDALYKKHGDLSKVSLPKEIDPAEKERLKKIAYTEFAIEKLYLSLEDVILATMNQIRKKQSRTYAEMAMGENEEAKQEIPEETKEEDEKPVYNPKHVPVGWDGKPIPYWLYKLHGLGVEYKCEICGGAIYYGRRAFERHFQEWRHAYGMKCLKIPNTVHFRDVTRIEDALKLYHKIMQDNYVNSFKPDVEEEFEDSDGNILNRKQYIDLKRQGLL